MKEFLSGCASGLAQNIIGHPLDTIKVLKQNNENTTKIKNIGTLYRGFAYPAIHSILTTGLTFEIYSNSCNYIKNENYFPNKKDNFKINFISGFITGILISPSIYFFDIGKIKSQMNQKLKLTHFYKTKGYPVTLLRESLATSLYLGSYFSLNEEYKLSPFYSGSLSGLINWTITYPIDLIKTRQMTYNITIKESIKIGGLWKGYYICAIRSVLVNGVGLTVYDFFKKIL
jgi:solute carrier family 25 carnitine/acylcarnitine transporter 20/29